MKQNSRNISRIATFAASIVATVLLAGPQAAAGPNEDQRTIIDILTGYHAPAFAGSFSPEPISAFTASTIEYSTNLSLKHLPPYLEAPDEIVVRPNAGCYYIFGYTDEQKYLRTNFLDIFEGWSGVFNYSRGDAPTWGGLLGGPKEIDHYHTDTYVSVWARDPETNALRVLGVNPDNSNNDHTSIRMPVGVRTLTWKGESAISTLLDEVPWYLVLASVDKVVEKAFKAAKNPAQRKAVVEALRYVAVQARNWGIHFSLKAFDETTRANPGVYTEVKQRFVVVDQNAPQIHPDTSLITGFAPGNPYIVRAVDPGGAWFSSFSEELMGNFTATDDCATGMDLTLEPELTGQVPGSRAPGNFFETNVTREVIIKANDSGPVEVDCGPGESGICYTELDSNETTLSFWVRVEDHEPPLLIPPKNIVVEATPEMQTAGKALRADTDTTPGDPAYIDVGNPAVFDLGDRYPAVDGDDGVNEFPVDARTTINWSATDIADNSSGGKPQVITVKSPGTNSIPTAAADAANARVSEPVAITLRGADPDVIDGVFDPLNFDIVRAPEQGFLLAPPHPYFIEDYRRTWQEQGAPCSEDTEDTIKFPEQISVADNGTTYVLAATPGCSGQRQISIFDRDGEFIGSTWVNDGVEEFIVLDGEEGAFDKPFGVPVNGRERGIYFFEPVDQGGSNVEIWHRPTDEAGNVTGDVFSWYNWFTGDRKNAKLAAVDSRGYAWLHDGRLAVYELQGGREMQRLTTFEQEKSVRLHTLSNGKIAGHMATDSEDNLYVTDAFYGRVYKFAPAMSDPDEPVRLIGWMGRCHSGEDCDVANERSFGFSCTDETCANEDWAGRFPELEAEREAELVACGLPTPDEVPGEPEIRLRQGEGCRPGQFNLPTKIALDANDNVYVADYANRRVQRFTPDGGFTGEAKSACDGSCFVLGDFGRPFKMTVNSFGFYVLDEAKKLLHVFEASPFSEITPNSAVVKYQSNHDILDEQVTLAIDSFDFVVSDGIVIDGISITSEPVTVNVSVSRNYRAPTAVSEVLVDGAEIALLPVAEDTPTTFQLQGRDPDAHDEPYLSYSIDTPPQRGSVIEGADGWQYIPDENYVGEDQFTFVASDAATSMPAMFSEPATVRVIVTPEPDPPQLDMPDPLQAGIGFPVNLVVNVTDVDSNADEMHVFIDWGDGCIDSVIDDVVSISCKRQHADNSEEESGSMMLALAAGNPGVLTAEHLYTSPGERNVRVCIGDRELGPGPVFNGEDTCIFPRTDTFGATTISVSPRADVMATFSEPPDDENGEVIVPPAGVPVATHVVLRNVRPSAESTGGDTPVATSVATIELDEKLAFASIPGNCSVVSTELPLKIACPSPPLDVGGPSTRYDFSVIADPALAQDEFLSVSVSLDATEPEVDGGYYWANLYQFQPNPALDPDGDGVPNADDAFPNDPTEWTDTDSDGIGNNADRDDDGDSLSDTWETRYGYDPLDGADADADTDGDGLSNRLEATQGTHPRVSDSDRDGHDDDVDNCPAHFNQQQYDENGDFLGDACDSRSFATVARAGDADADSTSDMALLKTMSGASTVYVKSGASDVDIVLIGAVAEPSQIEILLRVDNPANGPEVALAAVYTDGTGDAHVRMFNAWTGALFADYAALGSGTTLIAADVTTAGDALLLLGRDANGAYSVTHRDARDGNLVSTIEVLSAHHAPLAMAATGSDAAVLLAVDPAGDLVLEARRLTDGAFSGQWTVGRADGLQVMFEAQGNQLYTLTTSPAGESQAGAWSLGAPQPTSQFTVFDDTWMPFAIRAVETAAGIDALAIAASTAAGDVEVRIYDPVNGAELNAIAFLGAADAPRSLIVGNGAGGDATIGILASDAAANVALEQRAATTGAMLKTLTAASVVPPPPPPPPPSGKGKGGGGGAVGMPLLLLFGLCLARRRMRRG